MLYSSILRQKAPSCLTCLLFYSLVFLGMPGVDHLHGIPVPRAPVGVRHPRHAHPHLHQGRHYFWLILSTAAAAAVAICCLNLLSWRPHVCMRACWCMCFLSISLSHICIHTTLGHELVAPHHPRRAVAQGPEPRESGSLGAAVPAAVAGVPRTRTARGHQGTGNHFFNAMVVVVVVVILLFLFSFMYKIRL